MSFATAAQPSISRARSVTACRTTRPLCAHRNSPDHLQCCYCFTAGSWSLDGVLSSLPAMLDVFAGLCCCHLGLRPAGHPFDGRWPDWRPASHCRAASSAQASKPLPLARQSFRWLLAATLLLELHQPARIAQFAWLVLLQAGSYDTHAPRRRAVSSAPH